MEIWKSTRPLKWWFCGSFCAVFIVFSLLSIVLIFTQTKLDNLANNGIFGDFCVVLCSFCELFDVFFSYFSIFCKFLPTNPANFAKKDEFNISFPQNANLVLHATQKWDLAQECVIDKKCPIFIQFFWDFVKMTNSFVGHFDKVSKNWIKIVHFLIITHFWATCQFWVRIL